MLTIALVSVLVPAAAGTAYLALRGRSPRFTADNRGIALQTVIIMVVLLAIAGLAAGVMISRGGDAVSNLEQTEIGPDPAQISDSWVCEQSGHSWGGAAPTGSAGDCVTS